MKISIVHIHVKETYRDDFIAATKVNVSGSINEQGIARFDFLQLDEDPNRFVLFEVYEDEDARKLHKETDHYLKWRDIVIDMMAEPRAGILYTTIFPEDSSWSL